MQANESLMTSLIALGHSKRFVKTSKSYSERFEKSLPKLAPSEIEIGTLLGKGGYADVYEIKSFPLIDDNENEDEGQREVRNFLQTHVTGQRKGDCRYAVKYLRQDIVKDDSKFSSAAISLAIEVKILCSVSHPNIIKLRGLCSHGEMGFRSGTPEGFFLIFDRLHDTLDQRLARWRQQEKKRQGFQLNTIFNSKKVNASDISNEKLRILLEISAALKYLHGKNIIFRDLKPENIGFDELGAIKLFDFGLSKELSGCSPQEDSTYKLTGGTGSLRYMAPEVMRDDTYNLSADVYSFSILLWEVLSAKIPFNGCTAEKIVERVALRSHRPKICPSYPKPIKNLLKEGWSSSLQNRPKFDWIHTLFSDMASSQNITETHIDFARKRSSATLSPSRASFTEE